MTAQSDDQLAAATSRPTVDSWVRVDPNYVPTPKFTFTAVCSVVSDSLSVDSLPVEFFITDDIIVLLVTETNRYAQQFLAGAALKPNSRARRWTSTDATEMQKFLGMLLTMEIVKKPHIEDYWSTDPLLATPVTPVFNQTMSCDGFELLLKF